MQQISCTLNEKTACYHCLFNTCCMSQVGINWIKQSCGAWRLVSFHLLLKSSLSEPFCHRFRITHQCINPNIQRRLICDLQTLIICLIHVFALFPFFRFQNVWLWGFQQRADKCVWKLPAEPHQCDRFSGLLPHLSAGDRWQQPGARCAAKKWTGWIQHNQPVHTQPERGWLLLHHLLRSFPSNHILSRRLGVWLLYVQSGAFLHQPHHVRQQLHACCCFCWQVSQLLHFMSKRKKTVHMPQTSRLHFP